MTVTTDSFRTNFPAFASLSAYPDPMVAFWLALGLQLLNADRWDTLIDAGLQLFVAHNLALESGSVKAGKAGQTPGQIIGATTGGTVDKVSFSRDVSAVMEANAGHWNATTYGQRYIHLARLVGMGPMQIGVPGCEDILALAWQGPWSFNIPNPS